MLNGLLVGALRARSFSNDWRFCRQSRLTRSVFPFLRHAPSLEVKEMRRGIALVIVVTSP